MVFYEELKNEVLEILKPIFVPDRNIIWKESNTKSLLGKCKHISDDTCEIFISRQVTSQKILKEVIVHELIHSLKACKYSGHGGEFARIGNIVYEKTGIAVSRCGSFDDENYSENNIIRQRLTVAYIFKCEHCGAEYIRKKWPSFANHLNRCSCSQCRKIGTIKLSKVKRG